MKSVCTVKVVTAASQFIFRIMFASPAKKQKTSDFIGTDNKKEKKDIKSNFSLELFSVLFQVNERCIFCLKTVALPLIGCFLVKKNKKKQRKRNI